MKNGNHMELEERMVSCLQQSVPDGYTLRSILSIDRQKPRKYRVVLYARSRESNPELKGRSSWITSGTPRGRDAVAEGIILNKVTAADWEALQAKGSSWAPVESAPPRDCPTRTAAPEIGSLQEPGFALNLAGEERSLDPKWGGLRDYGGRPLGSLARAARRNRAVRLRDVLEDAVPGAFNLSPSSLQEVVRACII